jgi:hypothetical protein
MLLFSDISSMTKPLTSSPSDSVVTSSRSGSSEVSVPMLAERVWLAVPEASS